MKDGAVYDLARHAGILVEWRDYAGRPHRVGVDSLRAILTAQGLPCASVSDVQQSHRVLQAQKLPALITTPAGTHTRVPIPQDALPKRAVLREENGAKYDVDATLTENGWQIPAIQTLGYHSLEFDDQNITIAVAPSRCPSVRNLTRSDKIWGLAAQIYAVRRPGDCGIGDAGGVVELAAKSAALGADILALSPVHALFGAEPRHFSPYSPSNRMLYNPLYADARLVFGEERVGTALARLGGDEAFSKSEASSLIDWPRAAREKMALFRRLFEEFFLVDLANSQSGIASDFQNFRIRGGKNLDDHAVFEVLHADRLRANRAQWNWTEWPQPLRDLSSIAVREFAAANQREVIFQCFLQWLADRSFSSAQLKAKQGGMRVGLIADLAVGMSGAGSQAWASPSDILIGLGIGAPPDLYNAKGQNWGLTTFSPRALDNSGFAPFISTLRAGLRHAGGLRIDHAMGLLRLWVIPHNADPQQGAYLSYPVEDLLRLTALEAHRHGAIIIGEDLGTVPPGFRDSMIDSGMYGMRVLWFERPGRLIKPPETWDKLAAAMTSTHDLPTVAGWWRGADIETRAQLGWIKDNEHERQTRAKERRSLWRSFKRAGVADGDEPTIDQAPRAVNAAVHFTSQAASDITLLPVEDALALEEQPNLPGTIDEFPNWRRRYPGEASELLRTPEVRQRLAPLAQRVHR